MSSSSKHSRVALAALWLVTVSPPSTIAAGSDLPEFGDPSGAYLSPAKEKRLGQSFMRSIRATNKLEDDPLLNDYIESLGDKLVTRNKSVGGAFDFFLVRDPTINAFAGPGGHIGVNTGLILETETESELAAVLAHETAHVSQRHIARMIEAAGNLSIPTAGVLLAAILLGAAGGGDAAMAAAVGGQAALLQQQINFTRSNEQEADRIGMQILADAAFDPRAMPVFFQRLGRADRTSGITLPEFLRTHPVTTSRVADSLSRAESYPYRQPKEDIRYHLTRAALRAGQFPSPSAAVAHFESTLKDGRYRHRDAEQYGYALALTRGGRLSDARREIDTLLGRSPGQMEYIVASARLHKENGQMQEAVATLKRGRSLHGSSKPLAQITAEMSLEAGDARGAYEILRQLTRDGQEDPAIRALQARAAAGIGREGESHEHLAEHYYAMGDVEAALRQLEIASRSKDLDFYARSRIEARLQEVRSESEALRRDRRGKKNNG